MGFADDLYDATNATLTSNVNAGVNVYYDKKFLERVNAELRVIPLGQRRDLPMGNGKTVTFFRWLNLAVSTVGATLTEGEHPSATAIKGQNLSVSVTEYGAFAQLSSLLKKGHIDMNCKGAVEMFAEHAANVLETACKKVIASQAAYPILADLDAAAVFHGSVETGPPAPTTTTFYDAKIEANTGFGDDAHDFRQATVTFTSGAAYGQQRYILTSPGDATVTFTALDEAPAVGDTYTITSPHALALNDIVTYESLVRARTNLKKFRAPKHEGGYYVGVGSPDAMEGVLLDDKFIGAHTYKDSMETGLFTGEVGKFAGMRMIEDTLPFRFPTDSLATANSLNGVGAVGANYTATGEIESFFVFGKECFGVTTFAGQGDAARRPRIIVKTPGDNSTDQPLNRFGTVGWVTEAGYKGLNPLFGQQIWFYNPN